MTMPWGPAVDAEIDYRQQQVRADFRRRGWLRRKRVGRARRAPDPQVPVQQMPGAQIPVQRTTKPVDIPAPRTPPPARTARPGQDLARTHVPTA